MSSFRDILLHKAAFVQSYPNQVLGEKQSNGFGENLSAIGIFMTWYGSICAI